MFFILLKFLWLFILILQFTDYIKIKKNKNII